MNFLPSLHTGRIGCTIFDHFPSISLFLIHLLYFSANNLHPLLLVLHKLFIWDSYSTIFHHWTASKDCLAGKFSFSINRYALPQGTLSTCSLLSCLLQSFRKPFNFSRFYVQNWQHSIREPSREIHTFSIGWKIVTREEKLRICVESEKPRIFMVILYTS